MKYSISPPRSKVSEKSKAAEEEKLVAPLRGVTEKPDSRPTLPNLSLEELQRIGAIPPVIRYNNSLIVKRQKIAILSQEAIDKLKTVTIGKKTTAVRIVRAGRCPNPDGSRIVLLELTDTGIEPIEIASNRFRGENGEPPQANNFVLSDPPGQLPSPPIQDDSQASARIASDFQLADSQDMDQYRQEFESVVAVVDSGAKFDLANRPSAGLYKYNERRTGEPKNLRLERGKPSCDMKEAGIGYCGVGSYITPTNPIPPGLHILSSMLSASDGSDKVASSAFDDTVGRHGTYVTAIINQESAKSIGVLPIKAFNWAGYGTLFDILDSLNYVLAQKKAGVPIKVLNASWVGSLDKDGTKLLEDKFRQLGEAGIMVVAAAGNQGKKLGENGLRLYPACFSTELNNVITVTSVEPTFILGPIGKLAGKVADTITYDGKENILDELGVDNTLNDLFIRGYKAVGNYSKDFVSVGVFGRRSWGYNSPFYGEPALHARTSYAAAYVSGQLADYLRNITLDASTIESTRDAFLRSLDTHVSLKRTIQEGRMLFVKE